jgi:Immunoglobulin-like domain of bacterial spore germination/Sporulation and spore germination
MLRTGDRLKALATVLLLVACSAPPAEKPVERSKIDPPAVTAPVPARLSTPVSAAKPVPVAEKRNITITAVTVANPLVVTGRARTFENQVVFRARAADGTVIAESFTTSTGEMGQHNPYSGSLWLTREPGKHVTIEALEYSAKDGAETNLTRVEKPFAVAPIDAVLYFADANCTGVKPYTRRMPKSISLARLLVEALVHGPTAAERKRGAGVSFPEGSAVRSVILRGGILTVDFNERLQNAGGSCRAQMIRAAVTQTLRRLPAVKEVVITAGGNEKLALQP